MVNVLDMQDLRYLNLFARITRVETRYFFEYNNTLVFCVPKQLLSKALGENARNLKKMSEILKKRIKIVPQPESMKDAKRFIGIVVSPVTFNNLEIKNDEIVLDAGKMSKAALIGRDKRRLHEMQKIVKSFFKKDFRII